MPSLSPLQADFLKLLQFDLQFDDIGSHGTKVIIYNLWFSDDGNVELDFDTDPEVGTSFSLFIVVFSSKLYYIPWSLPVNCFVVAWLQDIRIGGDVKKVQAKPAWRSVNEQHIANRLHHSLRVSAIFIFICLFMQVYSLGNISWLVPMFFVINLST